jgi:hypothetical protein
MAITTNHDDDTATAPFTPSEDWIEAFERQNTDEMRKRAQRFARMRARFVARAGGRGDDQYAAELVHDALTDTLFGVLTWDPAVVPLEVHVFGAVRFRTKNDRVRALRFRHQSIEAAAVMCEVESTLAATHHAPSAESLAFSAEVLDQVRDLAADDSAILRIVDAVAQGASAPREIMSVAEMSEKTWRKARLRLARLVERMSNHVLLGARSHA